MRTRKQTPDPDIEPEYDFRDSVPNPFAERYRAAERRGPVKVVHVHAEPASSSQGQRPLDAEEVLRRWKELPVVDLGEFRRDIDAIIDPAIDQTEARPEPQRLTK